MADTFNDELIAVGAKYLECREIPQPHGNAAVDRAVTHLMDEAVRKVHSARRDLSAAKRLLDVYREDESLGAEGEG